MKKKTRHSSYNEKCRVFYFSVSYVTIYSHSMVAGGLELMS